MKRIIAVLLIICLVLSGCTLVKPAEENKPVSENEGTNQTDKPDDAGEPEQSENSSTLMDSARAIGELDNLRYIPNAEIEEMTGAEMQLFGNALLLWSNTIGDNGCTTELKLVSLENGEILGKLSLPGSGFVTIQTDKDSIGVCDSEMGTVRIFDSTLKETDTYTIEASGDNWYLSSDLKTLYQINWEKGVFARDLATGTTGDILLDATDIYVRNRTENHVVIAYTDLISQRASCRILNLQTGLLERLPVESDVMSAVFSDNTWLIGDGAQWGTYYVITDGQRKTAVWQENRFDLLLPQRHLLAVNSDGRGMSLYDTEGTFISKCEFSEADAAYAGTNVVWSDLWNGYFFIGFNEDQTGKLMFWDVQKDISGENFPLQDETEKGGVSADESLYKRAEDISDRFDVEILIADQCSMDYGLFSAYEANDSGYITQALDIMENALSAYPDGFFEQLKYGNIQTIRFELIGGLHQEDDSVYEGAYAGITFERADRYIVALDIYTICENNVYHEVTHITDGRLSWDAQLRSGALFSEDSWNKLLPEGFAYAETYKDLSDSSVWEYVYSGYFVNDYACRFATEDRATMMEMAMAGNDFIYEVNPHLYDKLEYYSNCIRDCFNTDGWPETTAWEEMLDR